MSVKFAGTHSKKLKPSKKVTKAIVKKGRIFFIPLLYMSAKRSILGKAEIFFINKLVVLTFG